ncbi:MAG: glycosyltransferase family 2 protein [Planctomycetales bacterium]|nr:glycosyltransferase family 2 protein [Planctomycetales bacterium]
MTTRFLTALPVYNEVGSVNAVLDKVVRYSPATLVVDDGSTDGTSEALRARSDIQIETHSQNKGYGAALITAFDYAAREGYEVLVTIDCDGQHEPMRIPRFVDACRDVDIVSGSRYLKIYPGDSAPPAARKWLNQLITKELNCRLGFQLTDAFCGFKAYRVAVLPHLRLTEPGYAMPLQLWVQAAAAKLSVVELPVPLIYLDEKRSFGGALDDTDTRLHYYRSVIDASLHEAGLTDVVPQRKALCGESS